MAGSRPESRSTSPPPRTSTADGRFGHSTSTCAREAPPMRTRSCHQDKWARNVQRELRKAGRVESWPVQPHRHSDRSRRVLGEAVSGVQVPPRRVCHKRYIGIGGCTRTNLLQQPSQDPVTDPATLVCRSDSHVDDMEVPPTITDQSTHSDGRIALDGYDVAGRPTTG
jgi:hypothetical protein